MITSYDYRMVPTWKSRLIGLVCMCLLGGYDYWFAIHGPDHTAALSQAAGGVALLCLALTRSGQVKMRVVLTKFARGLMPFFTLIDWIGLAAILAGVIAGFAAEHFGHDAVRRIGYSIWSAGLFATGIVLRMLCVLWFYRYIEPWAKQAGNTIA